MAEMPEGTNLRPFHPRDAQGADYVISASPGLGLQVLLQPSLLLSSHQLPVLLATGASSLSSSSSLLSSSLPSTMTTSTPPSSSPTSTPPLVASITSNWCLLVLSLLILKPRGILDPSGAGYVFASSLRLSYAGPDPRHQVLWFRVFGWVGRIIQSLTPSKCRYRLALRSQGLDWKQPQYPDISLII
ncbi:hypothetical protein QCA50_001186 [Cerrena zonata]|uniref:Uncharacterized protein n=1 Tax=Cerrena zonata TaxID=2478898 RepID=A0AAW0GZ55_9APHY